MAQKKAVSWSAASPPPMKRGRGGEPIDRETLDALYAELGNSGAATDGQVYDTRGKARTKADRYKAALIDAKLAEKDAVATRVWAEDKDKPNGPSRFAIVLRTNK